MSYNHIEQEGGEYASSIETTVSQHWNDRVTTNDESCSTQTGYIDIEINRQEEKAVLKRTIFSTIPIFMAYAGMITLQRSIKDRIDIQASDKSELDLFGIAVGNLYLGNLIFRLMHNFIFSFFSPHKRVILSYVLFAAAHLIIGCAYWIFDSTSLVWCFIAYLLAGVCIGSFEANLLSCLSPLGHETKSWAVIGIPIGFNGVSIGFYILFAIIPHDVFAHAFPYFMISGSCLAGALFFYLYIPYVEFESSHDGAIRFKENLVLWREWFFQIQGNCFALMIDMFCVSLFSSLVYYIYNEDNLVIYPHSETTIPRNVFQTLFNFFSFLGDFTSRKLTYIYVKKSINPLYFLILSIIGAVCVLSKITLLAPFGILFIMFANGSIYAQTTKHIDNNIDARFNLMSLSVWLFIGDIGSYSASLLVQPLQIFIEGMTNSTT